MRCVSLPMQHAISLARLFAALAGMHVCTASMCIACGKFVVVRCMHSGSQKSAMLGDHVRGPLLGAAFGQMQATMSAEKKKNIAGVPAV